MTKYAFAAAAALSALMASSAAMADPAAGPGPNQFQVRLNITEECAMISKGAGVNLTMAIATGVVTADAANTVQVQCTSGATANVRLTSSFPSAAASGHFRMSKDRNATGPFIPYTVSVGGNEVLSGGSVQPSVSNGGVQNVSVVVSVATQTTRPAAGDYTDWVTVEVQPYSAPAQAGS